MQSRYLRQKSSRSYLIHSDTDLTLCQRQIGKGVGLIRRILRLQGDLTCFTEKTARDVKHRDRNRPALSAFFPGVNVPSTRD